MSVLLVGPEPAAAAAVRAALAAHARGPCRIEQVDTLSRAHDSLVIGAADVMLVNPALPHSGGDALEQAKLAAPDALILPLDESQTTDENWLPAILRYISRRKSADSILRVAEEALFEEKERAQVTLNSIGDAVLVTDTGGHVTYLNRMAEYMTGWSTGEALGQPLSTVFNIVDGETGETAPNPAVSAMNEDRTVGLIANCILLQRNGKGVGIEDSAAPIHDRDGAVTGAVIIFRDVSQSLTETRKMAYLAQHDPLTGLPNRALLTERLRQAISLARRHHTQVALLFLDLDHFKQINDSLGHAVGDQALCAIANRLSACVRSTDTVCRLGGDEFVILLGDIDSPDDAAHIAEKARATITTPLRVSGHTLEVSASVGISIHPEHGADAEAIIRHADTAMYHAKANGRDGYGFFQVGMNRRTAVQRSLGTDSAITPDTATLGLRYLPQFNLASGRIVGVEALLRWADRERGVMTPDACLPGGEREKLSLAVGQWIVSEVCRQSLAWEASGLPPLPISFNVSAVQFRDAAFVDCVRDAIRTSGVEAHRIILEVSETVLVQDAGSAGATLTELSDIGVQLAIDHFGTGNLGLLHLKGFPIQVLKIDRSCVRGLGTAADATVTVNMALALGKCLGHRVIACGVETAEQVRFLQARACDAAQGLYLHHPLGPEDLALLLASKRLPAFHAHAVV